MESENKTSDQQSDEPSQNASQDAAPEPAAPAASPANREDHHDHHNDGDYKKLLAVTERGSIDHLFNTLETGCYVVFDIETTGGNPSRNGITEIFALRFDRGEVKETFYTMVNPRIRIPGIVRRMTGITNQMVRDAPYIENVMPGFVEFVGDRLLVSHNTIGDIKFLRYFSGQTTGKLMANYFLCTHLLAEKLVAESPDKSLKGLSQHLGFLKDQEIHRAEGDTYLTLELFKVLLTRLNAQRIEKIIDAIRFQGDYESALRLGWGVTTENLQSLPRGPGVFCLHDSRGKVQFAASAISISREVKKLSNFGTLPRQLLKSVLASSRISFEITTTAFAAALREAEILSNQRMVVDPIEWHQRGASFLYIKKDQNDMRISVGALEEGALIALGPIKGGGEVQAYLDQVAIVLGVTRHKNRRGFKLSQAQGTVLLNFLSGKRVSWLTQLWQRLAPAKGLSGESYQALYNRLATIKRPASLDSIGICSGIVCLRSAGGVWCVYTVLQGCSSFLCELDTDLDSWLLTAGKPAELIEKLSQRGRAPMGPYTAHVANEINRVAWWAVFGAKKMHGRFISLADLKARL